MKNTILLFTTILAMPLWALPPCIDQGSEFWDKCFGEYSYPNGDQYSGEWKNDLHHGYGTYIWANGDTYTGMWMENMQHGQGFKTWNSGERRGDVYSGQWLNNVQHGTGIYKWVNGDQYIGAVINGMPHGEGTYIFGNGDFFRGNVKFGSLSGEGVFTWRNGNQYIGAFLDSKRHGYGVLLITRDFLSKSTDWHYRKGDRYLGEWRQDHFDGTGTYYHADGRVQSGKWKYHEFQKNVE